LSFTFTVPSIWHIWGKGPRRELGGTA